MAKFRIECPHCGVLNTASTGIFSKKIIECAKCHTKIDIRAGRFASRRCPSCKSEYVYDMAKDNHICPICHKKIDSGSGKIVSVPCPQCGCQAHHAAPRSPQIRSMSAVRLHDAGRRKFGWKNRMSGMQL